MDQRVLEVILFVHTGIELPTAIRRQGLGLEGLLHMSCPVRGDRGREWHYRQQDSCWKLDEASIKIIAHGPGVFVVLAA